MEKNKTTKMNNNKVNGRGGARKGAGRPLLDGKGARASVCFRVTQENAELLRKMKEKGVHLGQAVDTIVPELAAKFGITG